MKRLTLVLAITFLTAGLSSAQVYGLDVYENLSDDRPAINFKHDIIKSKKNGDIFIYVADYSHFGATMVISEAKRVLTSNGKDLRFDSDKVIDNIYNSMPIRINDTIKLKDGYVARVYIMSNDEDNECFFAVYKEK